MYFYAEYARIFSDFFKATIFFKKIIYKIISFLGDGGAGELKIPQEVVILHA